MARISGGELLVRTLINAGVEKIFGLHGAHIDPLFQSCLDHDIPIVDTRHEVAAGHAAEGYARAGNRLGVATVTAGPGFTNVISSIANAYLDRTPVLYISGAAGLGQVETNTLQAGIDQVAVARPITKWAQQIGTTADIPRLVAQAIRTALSAPTGPVLLDIPMDVLGGSVEEESVAIPDTVAPASAAAPDPEAIAQAVRMLTEAARPVIMAGAGAWQSKAAKALRRFAETSGIPVYSDFPAHGLLPSDHPLYGGTTHKMADLAGDERPDVVLALGVRFGLFTLGASDLLVPQASRIIHIEADPREIGRVRPVALGIAGDSGLALKALNARADDVSWPDWSGWQRRVACAKADRRARMLREFTRNAPPIHPYEAVAAIADTMPEGTVVVGDGAEAYHWLNEVIAQSEPGSYITHGFLGCVGMGLGLSLGAQAARPDRPVLCLAGDGAVGFTIAEFDTMARHKLPIVTVVMNNHSWAASQHFQELAVGPNRITRTRLGGARYDEVAAGFGCRGEHVRRIEELRPAIAAAFASGEPTCINVEVDVAPTPPELHLLMRR
ncbi:MAG: thiamine pyrophosphate-binding protein [Sphingomonadales bacterium]